MTTAAKLDPVDLAFENAPEWDPGEVVTKAMTQALREAQAEVDAGAPLIPHAEVMRMTRERFGVK